MKHILLLTIGVLLSIILHAQKKTQIKVIGSVHNSTKYITIDTLLQAIAKFKPDIILLELDSSLMNDNGDFKIDLNKLNSLESNTAWKYKTENPKTVLRRYDVINRNQYYQKNQTFAKEAKLFKAMDSLFKNNMLNDTTWFTVSSLNKATEILNNFGYMRLRDLNSTYYREISSFRQNWMYKKVLQIIKSNKDLKEWYPFFEENANFWERRNQIMTNNIIKFSNQYQGKRILVLVGAYHKYSLMDKLEKLTKSNFYELDNL